jgi:hypothetical protein
MNEVNADSVVANEVTASEVTASTSTARKSPGRKVDPNSKLSQAREIYNRLLGSEPKVVKAAFQAEIGIPKQSANTYFYNIKRVLERGQ